MKRYKRLDEYLKKLKRQLTNETTLLLALGFDQLNVLKAKRLCKDYIDKVVSFNREEYILICREARKYASSLLTEREWRRLKHFDPDDYVDYVLSMYNPVTGYLYTPEFERKRLRMAEEILTAREYRNRRAYEQWIKKCANLVYTQSSQYGLTMADETVLKTFIEAGVDKVVWVAEKDDKTCEVCKDLDGQVFEIDKVPTKPHYNCRCRIMPYRVEKP